MLVLVQAHDSCYDGVFLTLFCLQQLNADTCYKLPNAKVCSQLLFSYFIKQEWQWWPINLLWVY